MLFCGFARAPPSIHSLLPLVVEEVGHHFHDRGEQGIPRRRRDRAMELDVVEEKPVDVIGGSEHLHHFLGDRRQFVAAGALGSQPREIDLDRPPGLEELGPRDSVDGGKERKWVHVEERWTICDEGPCTSAGFNHADGSECLQSGTDARSADTDQFNEFPFRWELVSRAELTALDELPYIGHHQPSRRPVDWA